MIYFRGKARTIFNVLGILFLLLCSLNQTIYCQQEKLDFKLEDFTESPRFFGQPFQGGEWAEEGPVITYVDRNMETNASDIMSYNLEDDEYSLILDGTKLHAADVNALIEIEGYDYNSDKTKVLIYTDSAPVWRRNTKGYYYVYDIEKEMLTPISQREKGYQMFAKFSPDGKYVGFVRDRNLFMVDLATMQEMQFTFDGSDGKIINGTTDWVYEEEFSLRDGWAWSPDSRYISFIQLDETEVSEYVLENYLSSKPELTRFKFPYPGEKNSDIRVGLVDIKTGEIKFFDTKTWKPDNEEYEYIPRFGWTPEIDGKYFCWMFRMNRDQNKLDLLYAESETGMISTVMSETSSTWVEIEFGGIGKIYFLDDNKHFLWLNDNDGFTHLYLYENNGKMIRQVTKGNWEITDYHGTDLKNGIVYFSGTKESPVERHLYKTTLFSDSGEPIKITGKKGTHFIDVSADCQYFIDSYSTFSSPRILTLRKNDGKEIKTLLDNAELFKALDEYNLPTTEFFKIPGADGTELYAYMMKPHDFDPNKKYPMLMFQYGGPAGQQVFDVWDGFFGNFHRYLVENLDVIVGCVDNRGTPGYGKAFISANYLYPGTLEPQDQVAVAKQWAKLPYIDDSRIGIWGWSYGGYNAIMSLLKYEGPKTFKYAIAIAPGMENELYDTIYTERYMLTPEKNPVGYKESDPRNFVDNMTDNQRLLIVHGDMDDNAHYQGTVRFVSALQKAKKQFELMIYPGGNHGLRGTGNRFVFTHLYRMMSDFIEECNQE